MMRPELKVFEQFLKAQPALKDYAPKGRILMTGKNEIDLISDYLNLDSMTPDELDIMKDFVVLFYEHLRSGIPREDDMWYRYWNSMSIVTSTISYVRNKKAE